MVHRKLSLTESNFKSHLNRSTPNKRALSVLKEETCCESPLAHPLKRSNVSELEASLVEKQSLPLNKLSKQENKNCDETSNNCPDQDPFVAESLEDIAALDLISPAIKQCTEKDQLKTSIILPASSEVYSLPPLHKELCENGTGSKSSEGSNVILRDSTATQSSPNKIRANSATSQIFARKYGSIFSDLDDCENASSLPIGEMGSQKGPGEIPLESPDTKLQTSSESRSSFLCLDLVKNAFPSVKNCEGLLEEEKIIVNKKRSKLSLKKGGVSFQKHVKTLSPKKYNAGFSCDKAHEGETCKKSFQGDCTISTKIIEKSTVPTECNPVNGNHDNGCCHLNSTDKEVTERNVDVSSTGGSLENLEMTGFEDDWDLSEWQSEEILDQALFEETLDLKTAVHCKVLSIEITKAHREWTMWVQCLETKKTASCSVRGLWLSLNLQIGDIICAEASAADETCRTRWKIDDTHGMIVVYPNSLVSSTAIVGSLFCSRRSVLAASFRGFDGSNDVMTVGTLVHEILQEALRRGVRELEDIKKLAENLLSDPNTIRLCYNADTSLSHVRKELCIFLPAIVNFISKYVGLNDEIRHGDWLGAPNNSKTAQTNVKQNDSKNGAEDWSGRITSIEDIEENLWDPMLGTKGKIDVTVKVREASGKEKFLPLELKTGRASHSAEHRGQVMLYSMMMSRLGEPVDSGLLLYLRENSIREVKLSHQEKRDLVMLRNNLVHYLELQTKVDVGDIENLPTLPDPINFENACLKCPYLTLCSVHLKKEKNIELEDGHPMKSLSVKSTKHLTTAHMEYFFFWTQLIRLEIQEELKDSRLKNIWSMTPEKREKLGQALVNLKIDGDVTENAGKYVHTFIRNTDIEIVGSEPSSNDFRKCGLNIGDYTVISTNTRIAVDTGSVLNIDLKSISLSLHRDLRKRNINDIFHVDTYESNFVTASNLTNLSCLLDDTETAKRVREAVIDKIPPTFFREISKDVLTELTPILDELNSAQRLAALAVLQSDRYALIKGLPGTGKTATMVGLVCLLVKLGQSVLITSQTHSAVDNLLLRLKRKGVNFLRLGSATRIHPELEKHSEGFVTRNCHTPEDLACTLESYQVVGVTCLGMYHSLFFRGRVFDICLVDESTQVLQSTTLRPLLSANRFVLVGDPDQLPPVVRSPLARQLGLDQSLFARLDADNATKSLYLNYRMNQTITDLANNLTYNGLLKCANCSVANGVLELPNLQEVMENVPTSSWLKQVLMPSLSASVLFLNSCGARLELPRGFEDTILPNIADKPDATLVNFYEVSVLEAILKSLVKAGVDQNEVGIIAPYRAQVTLIRKTLELSKEFSKVEVNSVDQYQGRDKQIILYSCTRCDSSSRLPKEHEILNDHRRLTVAITRAKVKLVLIGDYSTLKNYSPFARLFSCLPPEHQIDLPANL